MNKRAIRIPCGILRWRGIFEFAPRIAGMAVLLLCFCATSGLAATGDTLRYDGVIGPGLPETTLWVTQVSVEEVDYNTIYHLRFTLTEKGNENAVYQQFDLKTEQALDAEHSLKFVDLNFDGYLDIDARYYMAAGNDVHRFFLWNKDAMRYEAATIGNMEVSWYSLYPDKGVITSYVHDSAVSGVSELYKVEDGEIALQRVVDTTAFDGDTNNYHLRVTDYTTGAEVVTREEVYPEEDKHYEVLEQVDGLLWEGIE